MTQEDTEYVLSGMTHYAYGSICIIRCVVFCVAVGRATVLASHHHQMTFDK